MSTLLRRLHWSQLDAEGRIAELRRPAQVVADSVRESVARIIAAVRARGDAALREFSERYDGLALPDNVSG